MVGEKRDRIFFFVGFFVPISGQRKRDKNIGRFTISREISHVCSNPQVAPLSHPLCLAVHAPAVSNLPTELPCHMVYQLHKTSLKQNMTNDTFIAMTVTKLVLNMEST